MSRCLFNNIAIAIPYLSDVFSRSVGVFSCIFPTNYINYFLVYGSQNAKKMAL